METTEKQYKRAWKEFYKRREETNPAQAWSEMEETHGGIIHRRYGFAENGIYHNELLELKQILRDSYKSKQEQE